MMCRSHYEDYKKSCEEIHEKARYRNYPMSFSILSDFQEDDLQEMMDLGVKYSGQGSFAEPAGMVASPIMNNFYVRDMCDNFRNHSISNPVATSWASAAIIAAEAALQQSGNYEKLSFYCLYHYLLRSMEMSLSNVSPSSIIRFLSENGLKRESEINTSNLLDEICSVLDSNIRFDVYKTIFPINANAVSGSDIYKES